ncbi:hypothetical protein BTZ20_4352 [Rhodococcus sp. MTM3W5.2]|nr:hypothetical protein BTZ20_4352 [Rhodococcus sp. MTM3W5.2]
MAQAALVATASVMMRRTASVNPRRAASVILGSVTDANEGYTAA